MRSNSEPATFWRNLGMTRLIMGVAALFVLASPVMVLAQEAPPPPAAYVPRDMTDVQQLVAPIALYPDALLAQVLAATTYPDDVIAAAQWEDAGNNPQAIDPQPWDTSVKGVARYPAILHYLASNADWMNDLGNAFLNQQADVMSAVQILRGEALAAGTLVNTPQQTVINDGGYIQIIPTNPDILYPPIYNPAAVYTQPVYEGGDVYSPFITFGDGVAVGDWLDFDLDWYDRGIYFGHWGRNRPWWRDHNLDGGYHYHDVRPGAYRPGEFRDAGGHPITSAADHWVRDNRRPAPREVIRPRAREVAPGLDRGYAPHAVEPNRPAPIPRGADVSRYSERGQASRQRATPQPARAPEPRPGPAPEPVRQAPIRQEPVRQEPSAPRERAPAPEARQSAPVRGGAMGGYQSGERASGSAERGAASRGGGGGGGGGGGSRGSGGGGARGGGGGGRR